MHANPLAGTHRCQKAHLVEAVVDAHDRIFGKHAMLLTHLHQHRQRQKAVGNRTAERCLRGALLIHVNELVVFRAISEGIDAILVKG